MAFPQGINFRQTIGYVTDGANEDAELIGAGGGTETYPRTTAQGNNVGWETVAATYQGRDRNSGNDRRLAGINRKDGGSATDYRIDLPAPGNYKVGLAAGDASYARDTQVDLYDTSSSLGSLATGSTGAGNNFKDATNTEYSAANWPTSQTLVQFTFSTTICRFRFLDTGGENPAAHVYIEEAAAVATPTLTRLNASPLRWR